LYRLLPYPVVYEPYTGWHVVSQLQLLLFSGLAFFVMLRWLRRTLTITLDFDWFYRVMFRSVERVVERWIGRHRASIVLMLNAGATYLVTRVERLHGPHGPLARTWPSGSMALWTMVMLLALLVAQYLV